MGLLDYINVEGVQLNRVKIVDQTDNLYVVEYGDRSVVFTGSDESSFILGNDRESYSAASSSRLVQKMVMELKQDVVRSTEFSQEDDVPEEYKEVMIFHELREAEYRERGFEDAHQRATNDEVLYALKFMDRETRESYFDFASRFRRAEKLTDVLVDRIKYEVTEGHPDGIVYFLTEEDKRVYKTQRDFCVDSYFPEWILMEIVENEQIRGLYEDIGQVDKGILARAGRRLS